MLVPVVVNKLKVLCLNITTIIKFYTYVYIIYLYYVVSQLMLLINIQEIVLAHVVIDVVFTLI